MTQSCKDCEIPQKKSKENIFQSQQQFLPIDSTFNLWVSELGKMPYSHHPLLKGKHQQIAEAAKTEGSLLVQ